MKPVIRNTMYAFAAVAALNLSFIGDASAHCDALDGPVISEAQSALAAGDVTPLLKWVTEADEGQVKAVFDKAVRVRKQGGEAQELADRQLFATLVEVHRASEGAPYTGIKPAGNIDPALKAADAALAKGDIDALVAKFTHKFEENARERFATALKTKANADGSVAEGRQFIEAYVQYMHYLENVHNAISADGAHAH